MKQSELLLNTYDATLREITIVPKCLHTKVTYKIKIYDEKRQKTVKKTIYMKDVAAIAFHMNYFDNPIGCEVCGFYEIFSKEQKEKLLEENFTSRREGTLFHGDYDYDPEEPNDLLNYREPLENIRKKLDRYHLLQQHTTGGYYLFFAKKWKLK